MDRLRVLLLLLLSIAIACERRTEVKLEGGNPPTFTLSGSGRLVSLNIYGEEESPIWAIARNGPLQPVESLRTITYGVVPSGYTQVEPRDRNPPPLVTGKMYKYYFFTVDAPNAKGFFEIRDGQPIPVKGPMDCYEIRDGKKVPVECSG